MRVSAIVAILAGVANAGLFFEESRSDRLRKNLENIGYNILDSSGIVKDSVIDTLDPEGLQSWLESHGVTYENAVEGAKKNKDLLLEDIREYAKSGHAQAHHLLSKGKEYYDNAADVIAEKGQEHYENAAEKGQEYYETASKVISEKGKEAVESGKEAYDAASEKGKEAYEKVAETVEGTVDGIKKGSWAAWSDSRLKEFLDARSVPVPQGSTRDQLLAKVAEFKHNHVPLNKGKGPSGRYWFDGWSREELVKELKKVGNSVEGTRHDLADRLYSAYSNAFSSGEKETAKAANAWGSWKDAKFDSWSLEDIKDYLSEFGAASQGTRDELVGRAKESWYYFTHGFSKPPPPRSQLQQFYDAVRVNFAKLVGLNSFIHRDL